MLDHVDDLLLHFDNNNSNMEKFLSKKEKNKINDVSLLLRFFLDSENHKLKRKNILNKGKYAFYLIVII
jgi:hypothetical protein